jgi:hypothetical protein
MFKKLLFPAMLLTALLCSAALAQDKGKDQGMMAKAKAKKMALTGVIVDKMCSANMAKKEDPMAAAAGHTKGCALKEACLKSGLGMFADGKYYEFDEKGTAMAKAALEKSTMDKGAKFKVEGQVTENKMMVAKITEAK